MKRPRNTGGLALAGAVAAAIAAALPARAQLVAAPPAAAAAPGPVVVGRKIQRDWLKLYEWRPYLELEYRSEKDSTDQPGIGSTHNNEDRFEETLGLEAKGHIIHPNLVELTLAGEFGLRQTTIDATGFDDSGNDVIYSWDVSALILRREDYPITLYSRRTSDVINRQFGPSFDNTVTTTGAVLDWQSKKFPTRIEAYHLDQQQQALAGGNESFSQVQDTLNIHSEYEPGVRQRLTLDYTLNSIDQHSEAAQEFQGTTLQDASFINNDFVLSHTYSFGPKEQSALTSNLRFFDQSGDFASRRARWDELLRLKHTDNFETRYSYSFDYNSVEQLSADTTDQTQHRAQAGFVHKLYESLVTSANIGYQRLDESAGADSNEYFGDLTLDYRKRVPFGRLSLGFGFSMDYQENQARTETVRVLDQQATFPQVQPIVIPGGNVVADSLVITDPSGLVVYRPGLDYTVRAFPDRLEIDRVLTGLIGDQQTVLLDYDLAPQAANTSTTTTFSLSGRYDIERGPLKGVSVYARYVNNEQDIQSDNPDQFIPNSFTDILLGAEYRFWELRVGAEWQNHDSVISPYDSNRVFAQWQHFFSRETTFSLNATYNTIDYTDEDNRINFVTTSAVLQHRFFPGLNATASVLWRHEEDSLRGTSEGLEEQINVNWDFRQTHVFLQFRNASLETDAQDTNFQMLMIGFRREF